MSLDRRSQILQAGARCIARHGIRGLRITDVAAEAGVASGLLYYHFTDRSGLLAATLDYINEQVAQARDAATATDLAPIARLSRRLTDEFSDDPQLRDNSAAWNELRALAVFERDLRDALARTTAGWNAEVTALVEDAQRSGELTDVADPATISAALTALVEGLSGRWLSGEVSTQDAHHTIDTLLDGLRPAATGKDPQPCN
ncbi:TetR family transcriptional regulator [Flexivirga sp. ID2601S]|uniref:TetR family transcriptional regulator n=1 Tax=Flexivirga aerilata TaxID=1656889 RepID=A0A849AKC3_9MICO|nr:TetR family transcriptional regulator C-terminal domain-containing protein [Flexivirga aerilata]NNG39708.1 TetR family transcriptional regulator [Flexivirga aerilata]